MPLAWRTRLPGRRSIGNTLPIGGRLNASETGRGSGLRKRRRRRRSLLPIAYFFRPLVMVSVAMLEIVFV